MGKKWDNFKDKVKKWGVQLGIVAVTMAPISNVRANNKTSADESNPVNVEVVDYKEINNNSNFNEGDSIITNVRKQTLQLAKKDNFLEHNLQEVKRTDVLDNGYTMEYNCYMHRKNGDIKNHDSDYVLHTPDGRKVNCDFLNKINFISEGSIIDGVTGDETIRTKEYAQTVNALVERRANVEIMKNMKNPEDREAVKQYVKRKREEMDNLLGSEHTVLVTSERLDNYDSYSSTNPKAVNKKTNEFEKAIKSRVKDFRD